MAVKNKKAFFNYQITETIEVGVVLKGCEVKSIRNGHITIHESYIRIKDGEVYLVNCNILPYAQGNRENPPQNRDRKLLLHQRQIKKLMANIEQKGMSAVPTKLYFKKRRVKLEIGVGKPKKNVDKRRSIKDRELNRQLQRGSKQR
jgi:SsrA-binding protein